MASTKLAELGGRLLLTVDWPAATMATPLRENAATPLTLSACVGLSDPIEETWGLGAALRWMKRSPRASTHF